MPESKGRKVKKPRRPAARPTGGAARVKEPSPRWYVAIMFGLMGAGVALVLLRYIFFTGSNLVLVAGLASIAAGFFMTTRFR